MKRLFALSFVALFVISSISLSQAQDEFDASAVYQHTLYDGQTLGKQYHELNGPLARRVLDVAVFRLEYGSGTFQINVQDEGAREGDTVLALLLMFDPDQGMQPRLMDFATSPDTVQITAAAKDGSIAIVIMGYLACREGFPAEYSYSASYR